MKWLTRIVLRRAGWIVFLGTVLTVITAYYSVLLYMNLRTDVEELLPTTARSVIDLKEVTGRLESTESLAILVFSDDVEGSKRFVQDLAEKLSAYPKDIVASVEYKIDEELKFFRDRQLLFLSVDDLGRVRDYIKNKIAYEKELYNPINIFRSTELPEPFLDFEAMESRYVKKIGAFTHFPNGYYATQDEKIRVVVANLPGKVSGAAGNQRLRDAADEAIASLDPSTYARDIEVKFTGGVQNLLEEQASLIADLELSTVIVLVLCTAALLIFFRTIRGTLALLASLLMGTVWTFGAAYCIVGYLNANTAFLGAIVIGNGINFGIIYLARYIEELKKGKDHCRAIYLASSRTATATWTAALAAGLAYGSLVLTAFRGFNQFGVIGLIGMVLCWVSAFTLLPAMLTLLNNLGPLTVLRKRKHKTYLSNTMAAVIDRYPRFLWGISLAFTIASIGSLTFYKGDILQHDLSKLRDKESLESGSGYLFKYVDEIFRRDLQPMVLMPRKEEDAVRISERLKQVQKELGKKSYIASVYSINDFFPTQQQEKIKVIKQIKGLLPNRIFYRLSPEDKKTINQLLNPAAFKAIKKEDLPKLIKQKFTEKDGTFGKLVLVEPPTTRDLWIGENLMGFIERIRKAADSVAPGTPVVGQLAISSDMSKSISRDGPRATLFAFIAVVLLVITLFRSAKSVFLVLFALILGVCWMAGIIFMLDIKINFLNFIALPITFGIGVDYGVNIFQRYRSESTSKGPPKILNVLRHTGGAVGLASFTTIVGYGSLLLAGNQAFVSFGALAVLGEVTCLFAALVSLPAFLCYRERK